MASEHLVVFSGSQPQTIWTNPSLLNDYAMREGLLESTVTAEDVSKQGFRNPL